MLAIPLITLQAVVEVAVGGMLALFITDVTRQVTRGFLASTGVVLLVIGGLGAAAEFFLPDPSVLTDHPVDATWLVPSTRLAAGFMGLMLLYLVAVYLRPPVLHVVLGVLACGVGMAAVVAQSLAYPTPAWGPYGSTASFVLSAVTIGTVTTAMLLGHWYLVVPNLSTRPLFILLGVLAAALVLQGVLAGVALALLAGQSSVASVSDIVSGDYSLPFWMHVAAGIALPLLITGLAFQSTRMRSLMSATGLLYVAVVLALVGQITGKVVFFSGRLPV
ncbi:MAG: hypothetical protein QOE92_1696 [Chloroflexota bacterium]|jgi:hypothetical protein|nr:hypothetical protein [Chloroflexota bacterium]